MLPDEAYYRQLLQSYLRDELGGAEAGELFDYIRQDLRRAGRLLGDTDRKLFEEKLQTAPALPEEVKLRLRQRLEEAIRPVPRVYLLRRYWWAAAAAVLLAMIAGKYLWNAGSRSDNLAPVIARQFKNDVAPGGNKAILTLANGQQIVLDNARNGQLANQGNSKVVKVDSGLLAYNPLTAHGSPITAIQYNTLITPRGGEYRLILPDGSKVWLNAASSIRYPTVFRGKERTVEVTGEAYFEVAQNASMPFVVELPSSSSGASRGKIQVLGTHFNVNAYNDEPAIKVTLLEGSVKVMASDSLLTGNVPLSAYRSQLLTSGEEARLNGTGQIKLIRDADIEQAVAWKKGLFQFDGVNIQEVMRQLSRWYDVDVAYSGTVTQKFYGNISRRVNVSEVFRMLQMTGGVKFVIQGKKIIVTQ